MVVVVSQYFPSTPLKFVSTPSSWRQGVKLECA